MGARATVFAVLAAAVLPAGAASASALQGSMGQYVDLQLVLAVDVSRSMDSIEQRVQREGYVAAFRDPEVQKAVASGPLGRIAVTYVEWSGAFYQRVLVPWRMVGDEESALAFADELSRAPTRVDNRTSISGGLLFAAGAFTTSGFESDRRTIDVSGDGPNNEGASLVSARQQVLKRGININGLPLLFDPSQTLGPLGPVSLADYYEDCVIGGPGAFVVPVRALKDFAPAVRRKLILEIAWDPSPAALLVPVSAPGRVKIDCGVADSVRPGGSLPFP